VQPPLRERCLGLIASSLEKPCLATGLFRLWGESLAKLFVVGEGSGICSRRLRSLRSFLQESYVLVS
ncbi:MAG: hypothetical protein U1C13_05050, partial [Pseudomonas sp.]|nr:hypothetical protein [Pseudomonas sp.]